MPEPEEIKASRRSVKFRSDAPALLSRLGRFRRGRTLESSLFFGGGSFKLRGPWRFLMQKTLGGCHHGFRVEPALGGSVTQNIGDGHQAHALVVRQPAALNFKFLSLTEPRRDEIRRLVKSV